MKKSRRLNYYSLPLTLFALVILCSVTATAQSVTRIAGSAGSAGFVDGPGVSALFSGPSGTACDKNGNIYIADRYNNCIRKINNSGNVSTIAGTGATGGTDGPGPAASFNEPMAVACDSSGNIYVADTKNYKIRKVTPTGTVSTIAGTGTFGTTNGPVLVAQFGFPTGICVTPDGATIYVADHNTHVIRKIFNGFVSDLAGIAYIAGSDDGNNVVATFSHPSGIDFDNNGNIIVADEWNNKIRMVSPTGNVSTVAGTGIGGSTDGPAASALFNYPSDVTVDINGNIFVTDKVNNTIRKINNGTSSVTTYAGTAGVTGAVDGNGAAASFDSVTGIAYNTMDHGLYVADAGNEIIRKIISLSSIPLILTTTAVNNTVCDGDSIKLNATTTGLTAYTFKEGNIIKGNNNNGIITLPPSAPGQHIFTCSAFDAGGAVAFSQQLSITVLPQFIPSVNATGNLTFCSGDSIMLTAQAGTSYLWSSGSTGQNIYINTTGSFLVTVTNSSGCKGTSAAVNTTASQGPNSVITPAGPTLICAGDSVLLNASAGTSWLWSSGATTQSIYSITPGNYIVTIKDAGGCSAASSAVTVTNYAGSQATITPSGIVTIIQGDSVILSSAAANTYLWSNAATTQNIAIYNSGSYALTITTSNGCQSVSSPVQVIVITSQQLISANGPTVFCQGGNTILQSFFSQGNQWYFNGLPIPGEINQQITATDSGYYQVSAFQNNHWVFSDSLLVTVNQSPQVAAVSDTSVCSGTSPLIEAQATAGDIIDWYDNDTGGALLGSGNFLQCNPVSQNTTFYVEVTSSNGCKSISRAALNVLTNPSPIAEFQYTVTQQSGNYTVLFQNLSQSADTFTWIFVDTSGQSISSLSQPTFNYPAAGDYDVTLIASNTFGCIDTLYKKISIGGSGDWFIPTTFTPNNDGHNDLFRIRGRNVIAKDLKIYDQWGTLIYEAGENNPTWDGMVHGETVQNGSYIYKVKLSKQNTEAEEVTGIITVIK